MSKKIGHEVPPVKSNRVQVFFDDPSLTQQQFKDDCDLTKILERYTRTGELPGSRREGHYLDLTQIPDYLAAKNFVIQAENEFGELSAKIRERFHNDPNEYLQFCSDPSNTEEMVKLGLATLRDVAVPENETPESSQGLPAVGEGPKA